MALPSLTPVRGAGRRPWTRPGPGSGAGTAGGAPGDPRPWLPAVVLALVVAAVTAGALLLVLGPMSGTDGSAQVARADFWAAHPWSPLDLRWYGGVSSWGYSLLTPPLVAGLGTRGAGAVCAVVAAGALAVLLVRAEVRRPRLGAAVGAVALCGNLPPGRNAFALGTALGLLALVAAGSAGSGGRRRAAAVLLAVATPLASPVAGLFLALAGTALALTGRRRAGLVTLLAAGLPLLALQLLYGDGGQMPFAWLVAWPPVVAALAVAALAQPPARVLRTGALLYAAGVLLTYLVPMALGSNVERLALLLTAPLLAATAGVPPALQLRREGRGRRAVRSPQPTGAGGVGEAGQSTGSRGGSVEARGAALPWGSRRVSVGARGAAPPLASRVASVCARAAALPLGSRGGSARGAALSLAVALLATAGAARWQAGVPLRDLHDGAALPVAAYAPLLDALPAVAGGGRVEVVPLRDHGEAAVVARRALLARGWERQVDLTQAGVLYRGPLDPAAYRRWLDDAGVTAVVLPDAPLDWSAGPEAALLAAAPDYLEPVPVAGPWLLWRVRDPAPLVDAPARVVAADAVSVRLEAPGPGTARLRLRWSPLLRVTDGAACLSRAPGGADGQVEVRFLRAGPVRVGSGPLPVLSRACPAP